MTHVLPKFLTVFALCAASHLFGAPAYAAPSLGIAPTPCPAELDRHFVSYVDALFFVDKCTLRPVDSAFVIDDLTKTWEVSEITADTYRSFAIGTPFEGSNPTVTHQDAVLKICAIAGTEGRIVSSNNREFYLVQLCQKKLIPHFATSASLPNADVSAVLSVSPAILDLIPTGKPLPAPPTATLFPLKSEGEIAPTLTRQKLCLGLNEGQLLSFHDAYYCLHRCQLYPTPLPSLEEQQVWDARGGIVELTSDQRLGLMGPHQKEEVVSCPAPKN